MPASAFGCEEAVAVSEQVEVPVGPELEVHGVVALERERGHDDRLTAVEERVDLEHLVVRVEPDLTHRVLRELAEERRAVVVGRELRLARVVGIELYAVAPCGPTPPVNSSGKNCEQKI